MTTREDELDALLDQVIHAWDHTGTKDRPNLRSPLYRAINNIRQFRLNDHESFVDETSIGGYDCGEFYK